MIKGHFVLLLHKFAVKQEGYHPKFVFHAFVCTGKSAGKCLETENVTAHFPPHLKISLKFNE